jgi:sarcosine oxidase
LIGSAATRHLAEAGDGIACIGPDEPTDRAAHGGVFASHYDEGRMTRVADPEPEWSVTAKLSIDRYTDLENRSGIRFFTPAGYLGLGGPNFDYNDRCVASSEPNGAVFERLAGSGISSRFPYLSVADEVDGLIESGTAGHISPRAMVEAQTVLADRAGANIDRGTVTALRAVSQGVEIETSDGRTLRAEKALVAAGAFTAACGLSPVDLGLTVFGRTVVLVRIEGSLADDLAGMPTMIDCASGAYILPPIPYPDGHDYLKIGIGTDADKRLTSLRDMRDWFKSRGSADNRVVFTAFLKRLIPPLERSAHWHTDTCAVTKTANGFPVIDFVHDDKIAVAVGGCGKGAKGADEWGRIAAGLIQEKPWSSAVPRTKLSLDQADYGPKPKQGSA